MASATGEASDNGNEPQITLGVRVPSTWLEVIEKLCGATNRTKTDIAREAIGQYLQQNIDTIPDRIAALEDKVSRNNYCSPDITTPINQRLDKLEDIMQAILEALNSLEPDIKIVEKVRETISDGERYGGITQNELLSKYQLSYHQIIKESEEKNIPFHKLLEEKTGWRKIDHHKKRSRWLPPQNNATTTVREINGAAPIADNN